jgi:chromosome segregation ATPase
MTDSMRGSELARALDDARAERDEALRSIGEETKSYIEELETERDKAEAERDQLAVFAAEMSGLISDMNVPDPGLDNLRGMAETIRAEYEATEAERDQLRKALERIVKKAKDAWDDIDDLDDTGAHVGLAKYERTKADGLSIASDIARAALGEK